MLPLPAIHMSGTLASASTTPTAPRRCQSRRPTLTIRAPRRLATLARYVLDRDRLAAFPRTSRRHPHPQRLHTIVNGDGRRAIVQHVLGEILQLIRIRVAEALHEVRHGVVAHAVGLGH